MRTDAYVCKQKEVCKIDFGVLAAQTPQNCTQQVYEHIIIKEPASAGPLLPETGASKNIPPFAFTSLWNDCIVAGSSVAQSTIFFPSETPARVPFQFNM